MNSDRVNPQTGLMTWSLGVVFFAYTVMVVYWGLITSTSNVDIYTMYGFSQFRTLGWWGVSVVLAVTLTWIAFYSRLAPACGKGYQILQRWVYSHPAIPAIIALMAAVVFLFLSNDFLNSDGAAFPGKFQRIIPEKGALVTHDEILELFIHSKFWVITHRLFGWSVVFSYQLLSAIAGGFFIYLLLRFCAELLPERALGLAVVVITGGYMQLFFGDVENYTMTGTLILAYFYLSHQYTRRQRSLIWPSLMLAVAMMFHLLSGFLLPSLVYLYYLEWRRNGIRALIRPALAFLGCIAGVLTVFHFTYLPIRELYYGSHAMGHGGHFNQMLVTPDTFYYLELFSLFFLLMPASVLILPVIISRRFVWEPVSIHLAIGAFMFVFYMGIWEAKLGIYNDWNLFANVAIPVMLVTGYNLLRRTDHQRCNRFIVPSILIMLVHSLSWIIGNHNF